MFSAYILPELLHLTGDPRENVAQEPKPNARQAYETIGTYANIFANGGRRRKRNRLTDLSIRRCGAGDEKTSWTSPSGLWTCGDGEEEERRRETRHGRDKIGGEEEGVADPKRERGGPTCSNATVVRPPPPDGIWTASELWGGLNSYGHPTQSNPGMCLLFQNKDTFCKS